MQSLNPEKTAKEKENWYFDNWYLLLRNSNPGRIVSWVEPKKSMCVNLRFVILNEHEQAEGPADL